jgi:hypothetical protein
LKGEEQILSEDDNKKGEDEAGSVWKEVATVRMAKDRVRTEVLTLSFLGVFVAYLEIGPSDCRGRLWWSRPCDVLAGGGGLVKQIPSGDDNKKGKCKGRGARTEVLAPVFFWWRSGGLSEDRPFRLPGGVRGGPGLRRSWAVVAVR